jgi:multiple antibiotic resistance protein
MASEILTMTVQLFFIFTPFFVISMFLTFTSKYTLKEKIILVIKTTVAVEIVCIILFFGGRTIFSLFNITIDAFRIGAGAILFLSAVDLVKGHSAESKTVEGEDISVVPLAIPIVVGPGTTGTIMVMGSKFNSIDGYITGFIAVTAAVLLLGLTLFASPWLEKVLGKRGISILSRITGLILSAISAEMVFTGIKNILF